MSEHHANPGDLQGDTKAAVEQACVIETERRAKEMLSGKVVGKPGDQVFAELRVRDRGVSSDNGNCTPE